MNLFRQIRFVKGRRRYVFRFQEGQEADIVAAFVSMAADVEHDLDSSDAALLGCRTGVLFQTSLEHGECWRGLCPAKKATLFSILGPEGGAQ